MERTVINVVRTCGPTNLSDLAENQKMIKAFQRYRALTG